jgi:hypothetical protein
MKWVRLSNFRYVDLATLNRVEFSFTHDGHMVAQLFSAGSGGESSPLATYFSGQAYDLSLCLDVLTDGQKDWVYWNLFEKPRPPHRWEGARGQTPPGRADQADPPKEQPKG